MKFEKLNPSHALVMSDEHHFLQELLPEAPRNLLDLGCGTGDFLRKAMLIWTDCTAIGIEVDADQVLQCGELSPGVKILQGVAQSLPLQDHSFDLVVMLKSLHHVPSSHMGDALNEIARVLQVGGHLYVSEPLFEGPFNEIVRLFHDEQHVRAQAQAALDRARESGPWIEASDQIFMTPLHFFDYADFERRIIKAPYESHRLSAETEEKVRRQFSLHLGPDGVNFTRAVRARLLRKVHRA